MNKIIAIIVALLCLAPASLSAQKDAQAREVLVRTSSTLKKSGGMEVHFTLTSYVHGSPQNSMKGSIDLQGEMFRLTTPEVITWFDGKTQWSYLPANEEVNISNPTKEELQTINPMVFLNLYKKGYDYQIGKSSPNEVEIILTAETDNESKTDFTLLIDKQTQLPKSIRIKESGRGYNIVTIDSFVSGKKWNNNYFTFDTKQFPNAEVIDLR